MTTPETNETSHVPTNLQVELIRAFTRESDLSSVLADLVEKTSAILNASACTIFSIDESGDRATQRAGSGYQKQFNGKSDIRVIPANKVVERPEPSQELGITAWILSTGRPFLAETPADLALHPHHSGRFDQLQLEGEKLEIETFLGVPMRGLRGEIIGMIKAERQRIGNREQDRPLANPFSVDDELVLETIARVASRLFTYFDMAQQGHEENAITSWARDVIAETAATEGELDTFLDWTAKITAAAMRADSCGIFLKDESGKTLTQRAGLGSQALKEGIRSYSWPGEMQIVNCKNAPLCCPPTCSCRVDLTKEGRVGLTAWIAATGKSFYARNQKEISSHCHHRGEYDKWNIPNQQIGAFLGIPLQVGGRIIGVVKVENITEKERDDSRDFPPPTQQRFEILAQDIALSIKRLQRQIPARYRIIQAAQDTIFEILLGGLEKEGLVKKVVEDTRKLFNAGACALFLKEGNKLVQEAASGWAELGPETRSYDLVLPDRINESTTSRSEKVGLTVWIGSLQRKFTARSFTELSMHPHHLGTFDEYNFKKGEQCESFMGFPMVIKRDGKNELIGVLKVETKKKKIEVSEGKEKKYVEEVTYFNELDEIVFELIARSAAIAIQNTRLQQTAAEATQKAAWEQFSAMAAHRVGTEAANIGGALRWLTQDLSATTAFSIADSHLRRIVDALRRIDLFVQEFTEFNKPLVFNPERVSVNELCRQALLNFTSAGEGPRNNLELHLGSNLSDIWGDREKLLYAFKEIGQNSIKAFQQNMGTLTVTTSGDDTKGTVCIEFADTGPGVKPELKERIFEPGFKDRSGGTGLGLAIVASTIKLHKGTIKEVGVFTKGARFVIELPIHKPAGDKHRILIVEDSDHLREDLEKIVKWDAPDRQVVTARNGREAISQIAKAPFDVVLTDINMTEGGGTATDGLQVLEAAIAAKSDTAVIVVTSYGNMQVPVENGSGTQTISVEERAKQMGCFAFISRPNPNKDYLDMVKEAVTNALRPRAI